MTAKEIRESLCVYPGGKFKIPKFILESFSLSLEVFLHTRIGELYISPPKAVVSSIFIFLTLFLAIFGFSVSIHPDPTQIGGVSVFKCFVESVFTFEWREAWENLKHLVETLVNPETRIDVLGPVQILVVAFSVMVNVHFLINFLSKHRNPPRLWHPRSSGEPWPIWNFVYRIGHHYNMKVDLVKQFCEPLLCFMLGEFIKNRDLTESLIGFRLPDEWQFMVAWLKCGAFALLIRAYIENKNRKKLGLDRLANEFDAQAFELQDELYSEETSAGEFVEAVGKK